jgi:DNA polymerase III gamma/tau subunit
MEPKKRILLDSLYSNCRIRTNTSKNILNSIIKELNDQYPHAKEHKIQDSDMDQVIEIIREYKNTGKNLENTVDILYTMFEKSNLVVNNTLPSDNTTSNTNIPSSPYVDGWSDDVDY